MQSILEKAKTIHELELDEIIELLLSDGKDLYIAQMKSEKNMLEMRFICVL